MMLLRQPRSALVVDDVLENREVLEQLLRRMGCQTASAENGEQALEAVARQQPDIVLMDIRMAGMDGIEAAEKLWDRYGREPMKIAAISASVLDHERRRYMDAGFDYVLDKPVVVEQIVECLQRVLGAEFVEAEDERAHPAQPDPSTPPELAPIDLPADLARRLREATEYYNITDLGELIDEVELRDQAAAQWAARLRERAASYDMQGVLALLAQMDHGR